MRLIDADAAVKCLGSAFDMQDLYLPYMFEEYLNAQPTIDAVSRGVLEQVMWERDLAISQLNEIGKSWGEKMDNVATVVRCKDCISFDTEGDGFGICQLHEMTRREEHFCSDGERSK